MTQKIDAIHSLAEVQDAVKKFSVTDQHELLTWLDAVCEEAWDREIEVDGKAGRFDGLAAEALNDLKNGRTTEL